ncbi:hypothetical protein HO133_009665 [Letharia lupina]|uniref:Uncharacterized protein n=1 Tax=Letharia lupina TaxID=560253 RepID=A0A8H6FER1_9LECA|nr:uncharacterized protein HO133_009665 [Letharia lupina]KAF6225665.1 hypothetical protein HO133_009665 [Letharia lupina]
MEFTKGHIVVMARPKKFVNYGTKKQTCQVLVPADAENTILQRIRVMDSWPAQSEVGQESDDGELSSSEESERASVDSGKASLIGH